MTSPQDAPASSASSSPPRAFAQGVGLLCQTFGVLLFLSSCCVCSLSGAWDQPIIRPPQVVTLGTLLERPDAWAAMLTVFTATLAGLALAAFGLGLQADRRAAPLGTLVTTLTALILLLIAAAALWFDDGTWPMRLWNGLLLLLFATLTPFAFAARRQFCADPPAADVDIVPPDQKIPYSWYHDDPPDGRLEREIAEKKARLDAEQRELEEMRQELERKRREGDT